MPSGRHRAPGKLHGPEVVLGTRPGHHADIISSEGQSYRRRAAEECAAARKPKPKR